MGTADIRSSWKFWPCQSAEMAMTKSRTVAVKSNDLDFMVHSFSCHDGGLMEKIGKHCVECKWTVQCGLDTKPVDIEMRIDQSLRGNHKVSVKSNGEKVFP